MKIVVAIFALAASVAPTASQLTPAPTPAPTSAPTAEYHCSVCGLDVEASMTNMDARFDFNTCAEYETSLKAIKYEAGCVNFFDHPDRNFLHFPSFCGCEGAVAPDTCKICADDEILFSINRNVPWYDDDKDEDEYTCEAAAEIAKSTKDAETCSEFLATDKVKQACCRKPGACSICRAGATMSKPNKGYREWTCQSLNDDVKMFNSVQCEAEFEDYDWLDLQSYCGCERVLPPKTCDMCGPGKVLGNKDALVPWEWSDSITEVYDYTCEYAYEMSLSITYDDDCEIDFATDLVRAKCCVDVPSARGVMKTISKVSAVISAMVGFAILA
jgi:hypothetical protein